MGLAVLNSLPAQTLAEKLATMVCDCLGAPEELSQLEESLDSCKSLSLAALMEGGTEDDWLILGSVNGITGLSSEVDELLVSVCYPVRRVIVKEKEAIYYVESASEKANAYYTSGNGYLEKGHYAMAAKEFRKAVKADRDFVFAWDHLAVSWRRQEDFKKAIRYYKKSLEIFPEGKVALQNIAVIYAILEDYPSALAYYRTLIFLYEDDPEGYFGAGKIAFIMEDYEMGLSYMFIAHRMYAVAGSDYIRDSEELIGIMYRELRDKGQLELFTTLAEKYSISFNIAEGEEEGSGSGE